MRPDLCFFCGEAILGKRSREHIFGDSFLAYLGLKQEKVSSSQPHPTSYSRVKVPAHKHCNNGAGSAFERYVLSLIRTMDFNLDHLAAVHTDTGEPLNEKAEISRHRPISSCLIQVRVP